MREQALREAQADKFDVTVKMLTAPSIESRARKPRSREGRESSSKASGRWTARWRGRVERQGKREEREREREREITQGKWNESAAEGVCLSMRPSQAVYIGMSVCRYKGELADCNASAVSKFKNKNRVTLL
jgi:hypothetical protein